MENRARAIAMELVAEITRMEQTVASLPRTEGELTELLNELADAATDRAGHFDRFPRLSGAGPYEATNADIATVEADWSRCMARHDKAVSRLTTFAQTVRNRKPF
jgi:hypothetical protein